MSRETPSKKIGRGVGRDLDAGPLQSMVGSFELHLRAEKKSPKTIRTYVEAAQWLAAEYLVPNGIKFWADVRARDVQEWTVILLGRYSDSYANNHFRALQQFFKWPATEAPTSRAPTRWPTSSRRRSVTSSSRTAGSGPARQIAVSNFPTANGSRIGVTITTRGDAVTLRLTGNPSGPVTFELPAFVNNIASASAGTADNGAGAVTIPARTRSVTVTLAHAPAAS